MSRIVMGIRAGVHPHALRPLVERARQLLDRVQAPVPAAVIVPGER
ncbi:MAG: hypothetical protein ACREMK_12155 [Gemmatimonadota bacterium]